MNFGQSVQVIRTLSLPTLEIRKGRGVPAPCLSKVELDGNKMNQAANSTESKLLKVGHVGACRHAPGPLGDNFSVRIGPNSTPLHWIVRHWRQHADATMVRNSGLRIVAWNELPFQVLLRLNMTSLIKVVYWATEAATSRIFKQQGLPLHFAASLNGTKLPMPTLRWCDVVSLKMCLSSSLQLA